jgi:hypothetical protein
MRIFILTSILLIGLYALLRNNVGKLPEQIVWITNPEIFYKTFIPLLMIISAISSLFKKEKKNLFLLSFVTMVFDTINRLSVFVNHLYVYYTYGEVQPPERSENSIRVVINLWPSHIMLIIEIVLIVCLALSFKSLYGNEASGS